MDKKITIAIDGFSSTGKSTLAKQLANHLGYAYVDTGAMYRAVTLYAMQEGFVAEDFLNKEGLTDALGDITLQFLYNPELGFAEMYLNEENVERKIRTIEVSSLVSRVAEISAVRAMLVKQQQHMGENKGVVMDGRDIGTVVFPNAELKLFMSASPQTRAERRFKELTDKGDTVTYEEVLHNVQERDYIDTHREDSPLVKAEDAIEIDNSHLGIKEQFDKVLDLVNKAL
ncbi:cytidylate kinase [Flavobacterium akiainvivens]|uniref:Cytidylate kinase n=1 Tax=Flavobacterium akiainvivens TaxID=1202724 RepID=A0A0M8MBX5_9FLAO|nr:(d)CMP kinase [Flavobacterium akiainvivens]KOS07963.1 cytidylate kinase [Flavobacterium akiainvivens]SFQ61281.1 cytidylate kinase [Flavobacterium akiainvivens]